ncbi:MAG: antibiotic biosynthesis monooxygenase [Pseudorhodobacter sp.]|nr:antibiotic biosynthesis monooxygenase [Pseudorhodobacter sp.]
MYAVFFEMRPHPGHLDRYFEHVARLQPVLKRHSGLAFLERYGSLNGPDLILSHQLWESEAAIADWRADPEHQRSQTAGRQVHFADYRIRVGARVLHWHSDAPAPMAPVAAASEAPHILALYGTQPMEGPDIAVFKSVSRNERYIGLVTAHGRLGAEASLSSQLGAQGLEEAAIYSISRDYSRLDRAQAPNRTLA